MNDRNISRGEHPKWYTEGIADLRNYTEIVRKCMIWWPETRSDDALLIIRAGRICKDLKRKTPSAETITRCRRKIQNSEGVLLPTQDVYEKRNRKQWVFRGWATGSDQFHNYGAKD